MAHLYYNRLRPVGLGTIPKGLAWEWVEQPGHEFCRPRNSNLPISRRPYGVFDAGRPLTREELYDYEISPEEPRPAGDRAIPTTCVETLGGDPNTAIRLSFQIKVF